MSDRLIIAFVHGQNNVKEAHVHGFASTKLTHEVLRWTVEGVKSTNKEPKEATKWRPLREFIDANTDIDIQIR